MATFMVDYDLNQPGQNYDKLIEAIKTYDDWCHPLKSTWMVKANASALQVLNHLLPYIDANDKLLVVDVTNDSAAWEGMSQEITNWIQQNLR